MDRWRVRCAVRTINSARLFARRRKARPRDRSGRRMNFWRAKIEFLGRCKDLSKFQSKSGIFCFRWFRADLASKFDFACRNRWNPSPSRRQIAFANSQFSARDLSLLNFPNLAKFAGNFRKFALRFLDFARNFGSKKSSKSPKFPPRKVKRVGDFGIFCSKFSLKQLYQKVQVF